MSARGFALLGHLRCPPSGGAPTLRVSLGILPSPLKYEISLPKKTYRLLVANLAQTHPAVDDEEVKHDLLPQKSDFVP